VRNRRYKRPGTAEQTEGLTTISQKGFVDTVAEGGALAAGIFSEDARSDSPWHYAGANVTTSGSDASPITTDGNSMPDEIVREKIRRARLSGPPSVTGEAAVVELDAEGKLTIQHKGGNQWVCFPGNEEMAGFAKLVSGHKSKMGLHGARPFP
jgi:hypothetical protein